MIDFKLEKKLVAANGSMFLEVEARIQKNQLIAFYGPSGAGKTSILRMIAGLMEADNGFIKVDGETWLDTQKSRFVKPQNRKLGFAFQEPALFPNMTVKENLYFALEKQQDSKIIQDLIELTELGDLQTQKPQQLSGGQKQRVALARALVRRPQILLLDEPLSALNDEMREKLQNYLLTIHGELQLTTLLVSHDKKEVFRMADWVYRIKKGKFVEQGSPLNVFFPQRDLGTLFEAIGEIISIEKQSMEKHSEKEIEVVVLLGQELVKVLMEEKQAKHLKIRDRVLVQSAAFEPIIKVVDGTS